MRLLLPVSLLLLSGLMLTSCRVPNLNQTATFAQANPTVQSLETEGGLQKATLETWNYAKLSTFTSQGVLQATWVTDEGITRATGGVLDLVQTIMGTLVSDTDDSFIIFFNYLGEQGWELIQIRDVDRRTEYYFKQRSYTEL